MKKKYSISWSNRSDGVKASRMHRMKTFPVRSASKLSMTQFATQAILTLRWFHRSEHFVLVAKALVHVMATLVGNFEICLLKNNLNMGVNRWRVLHPNWWTLVIARNRIGDHIQGKLWL